MDKAPAITRNHSCTRCQRRKIKCDGQNPCAACLKVNANCERNNRNPTNHAAKQRRRAPRASPADLSSGVEVLGHRLLSEVVPQPAALISPAQSNLAGPSHPPLAGNVPSSHQPFRVESILFDKVPAQQSTICWPHPAQMFQLWQTYVDNVNPMTNLLHIPTTQRLMIEASKHDYEDLSKETRALLSTIFLTAIESLGGHECWDMMGESRESALHKHFVMAKECLLSANLMDAADAQLLQAFALYLMAARQHSSPQSLWLVVGVAVRLAHRLGIHREKNLQTLTVFTAEMNRRLWWQIYLLNRHYTNLCVTDSTDPAHALIFDTKRPLNLNDADLHPDMTALPNEKTGITEMVFCSIRYEIGDFVRRVAFEPEDQDAKSQAVQRLEADLHDKYARHCDASIPLQRISRCLIKTTGCRLALRHCLPPHESLSDLSPDQKRQVLDTALLLLQTQHSSCASPILNRYRWHTKLFYCFEALFPVLHALAFDRLDDEAVAAEAWKQVELAYQFNPELLDGTGTGYHNNHYHGLRSLALKAWSARTAAGETVMPEFIVRLSQQQLSGSQEVVGNSHSAADEQSTQIDGSMPVVSQPFNHIIDEDLGQTASDGQAWEYWLNLIENEELMGF